MWCNKSIRTNITPKKLPSSMPIPEHTNTRRLKSSHIESSIGTEMQGPTPQSFSQALTNLRISARTILEQNTPKYQATQSEYQCTMAKYQKAKASLTLSFSDEKRFREELFNLDTNIIYYENVLTAANMAYDILDPSKATTSDDGFSELILLRDKLLKHLDSVAQDINTRIKSPSNISSEDPKEHLRQTIGLLHFSYGLGTLNTWTMLQLVEDIMNYFCDLSLGHQICALQKPDTRLLPSMEVEGSNFVEKIQNLKNAWDHFRSTTSDPQIAQTYIITAGTLIMNHLIAEKSNERNQWLAAVKEYLPIYQQLDFAKKNSLAEFKTLLKSPEVKKARDKVRNTRKSYLGDWQTNAEQLRKLLQSICPKQVPQNPQRFLAIQPNCEATLSALNIAMNHYPAEWVTLSDQMTVIYEDENSNITRTSILVATLDKKKSFYRANSHLISLSPNDETELIKTSFHELGHRFYHTIPEVHESSNYFLEQRIAKYRDPVTRRNIKIQSGKNYFTYRGGFFNSYTGRIYDASNEIVSTGCEHIFTNPVQLWEQDPEHAAFIYGILALCGKSSSKKP